MRRQAVLCEQLRKHDGCGLVQRTAAADAKHRDESICHAGAS